jgi:hypothetical protein
MLFFSHITGWVITTSGRSSSGVCVVCLDLQCGGGKECAMHHGKGTESFMVLARTLTDTLLSKFVLLLASFLVCPCLRLWGTGGLGDLEG